MSASLCGSSALVGDHLKARKLTVGIGTPRRGKCNDSTVRFPYNVNDAGDDRLRSKLSSPMLSAD